jgi:hypothetical protein
LVEQGLYDIALRKLSLFCQFRKFPGNYAVSAKDKSRFDKRGNSREHLTFVTPKSGFMSSYFESLARNQF